MRIGFIGMGVVGMATSQITEGATETRFFDPMKNMHDSMMDCDAVFISVPVPTNPNGHQESGNLIDALNRCPKSADIFVRSSVLPGTCDTLEEQLGLNTVHALPEFLTERQAAHDAIHLPLVVPMRAKEVIKKIFPNKKLLVVNCNREAEMTKYAHNAFCAVKVGFFNTLYNVCAMGGLNYESVVAAVTDATDFVGKNHTAVPGPDGNHGFGGKCLPKDLFAFTRFIKRVLDGDTFLEQVLNENFKNRFGGLFP